MNKTYCDNCGQEHEPSDYIDDKASYITLLSDSITNTKTMARNELRFHISVSRTDHCDLCEACSEKIFDKIIKFQIPKESEDQQ